MENMDKGLTVQKWVLIVRQKIPQMPQNLSAQFACPSPKVLDFDEKKASLGVRSPCLRRKKVFKARLLVFRPYLAQENGP